MSDEPATVLLTGGSGVLGWRLARRFARAGHSVYLLVRKPSRKALRERVSALRADEPDAADRMRLLTGDLLDASLFDDEVRARVVGDCDAVVHAACERRSDKPRDRVFDTNLGGTTALLDLAATLERPLRRFLHVSDLSVVGDHDGVFFEDDLLVGQDFGDDVAAESRLLAERRVRRAMKQLPATVLRAAHPAVALRDPSRVPDPLERLRGSTRARLRRFLEDEPAPFVHALPADLLADAVLAAFDDPSTVGQTLHLADPAAPTADELLAALGARGSARTLCLPAERARIDTTAFDGLLRRRGLRRPGTAGLLAALGHGSPGSGRAGVR